MAKSLRAVVHKLATARKPIRSRGTVKLRRKMSMRKKIKGGLKLSLGDMQDLGKIWNALFWKKIQHESPELFKRINPKGALSPEKDQRKALFVIDMQLDFLDDIYTRKPYVLNNSLSKKFPTDVHPIFGGEDAIGNFFVGGGASMLVKGSEFLKHVSNAVASPDYKHVIFSRDYHPIGHSSFNGGAFTQYPQFFCTDRVCLPCDTPGQIPPSQQTGNFPPHCVQGFEGSKFHKEIVNIMKSSQAGGGGKKNIKRDAKRAAKIVEEAEKSKYEEWKQAAINEKVQILFKGMHKEVDSFTAVPKEKIDHLASDKNTEKNPCPNCKLITGGYRRVNGNLNTDIVFNFPVRNIDKDFFHYTQKEYETMFNGVSIIEVCGLAGDYCVRDTVVALAEMFPEKTIVLLGDFTRYACLPFYSMQVLPQHNYSESFIPFDTDDTKKQKIFNRVTSGTADTRVEKGIIYYIIKMLEDGKMQLMSADEINIEIKEKSKLFDFRNPTYQHFITPHKSIMRDYEKKNIHIEMTKPEILSSETSGAP